MMATHILQFLLLLLVCKCGGQTVLPKTPGKLSILYDVFDKAGVRMAPASSQCTVSSTEPMVYDHVQELIKGGARLLYIKLRRDGEPETSVPYKDKKERILYRPLSWARATGRYGTGILLLKRKLQIISMTTLNIGVEHVHVNITDTPRGCLFKLPAAEFETITRDFLIHEFMGSNTNDTRKMIGEKEQICNMHLRRSGGMNVADFYFECCHVTEAGEIKCKEMVVETLMNILLACVLLFNVIAVMFSPLLIPRTYFKEKFRTYTYEHHPKEPITLKAMKKKIQRREEETAKTVSASKMCKEVMENFGETLQSMTEGIKYKLHVSKIEFQVKAEQLVAKDEAPVGILTSLYEELIMCDLRHRESVKPCCKSDLFGCCSCTHRRFTWFKCLHALMRLVFAVILCVPWLVRVFLYYYVEHDEAEIRKNYLNAHGMIEPFSGKFVSYFTPIHYIFIICYAVLVLDGLILGALSKHVARMVRMVIRKCFRDMHHSSRAYALGWCVQLILKPLTNCGICGLFLLPLWLLVGLPVSLVVMAFYLFPTLNIIVRLVLHFFAYCISYNDNYCYRTIRKSYCIQKLKNLLNLAALVRKENLERPQSIQMRYRFLQLAIILVCLVSVMSFTLLAMECIVFFAELVIYSIIGIILNASFALKYVSVSFMIILYARECFGSVKNKYLSFNSEIHAYVLGRVRKKMKVVSAKKRQDQKNTAFILPTLPPPGKESATDPPLPKLKVKDGIPKWVTHQLAVFLDRDDATYITDHLFFNTVNMPHSGGPGNLLSNILSAIAQFMVIILFLLFVILVVMIFGDEYKVSGFNQMMATLVTGFLPWVFRNILFKPQDALTVDTANVNFENSFDEVVREYKHSWELADLTVDKLEILKDEILEPEKGDQNGGQTNGQSSDQNADPDIDEGVAMITDKQESAEDFVHARPDGLDLIVNTARELNKAFQIYTPPV